MDSASIPVSTGIFPWKISSFAPCVMPSSGMLSSNAPARSAASARIELIFPAEMCSPRTEANVLRMPSADAWQSSETPKGCTKGSALKKLWELEKWDTFTVAAAGDYNNDLEMLEFADIAIAPQNAQDIVKNSADYVTKATCEEGAIAEAIEYLDKLK